MLFVKGQANVPGKDNVPDSSLLALIQNYSNRRRETFACAGVGNNYFSSRGTAGGTANPARCWPVGICPGFNTRKTGFRLPSVLVYQIRNKASASRTEDEVHFLAGVAVMVYR
jgi:hypothetical protein